ncbi:conjugal transfer protein [Streptomyces shenzhenensis]
MTETRELTTGQCVVLIAATLPMVGAGGLGAWGTYTNIATEFGRAATALGIVAAGEGVTFVLALVMVLLTMLGQSAPWPVRAGLWAAPLAAAFVGIVVADTPTEAVVYGITPMAMCASAEGLGLVARRIVVYRTKIDIEAQRRNADTMRSIAYHRARAERHPWTWVQSWSELVAWRLLRRAGQGDAELGAELIGVQRVRLTEGADLALGNMLAVGQGVPALPAVEPEPASDHVPAIEWFDDEPEPEPDCEPEPVLEPEPVREPEPEHDREPEQQRGESTALPEQLPRAPQTDGTGSNQDHTGRELEREPGTLADAEQLQILKLADRLRSGEQINGKPVTKTTAAPLLGVSPATAQRRLTQAHRVVKLAARLKAGDRLTPAAAASLLGVDERTAGRRLNEARQLNGEGQGFYA